VVQLFLVSGLTLLKELDPSLAAAVFRAVIVVIVLVAAQRQPLPSLLLCSRRAALEDSYLRSL